jgi:COMPASS component SWD3
MSGSQSPQPEDVERSSKRRRLDSNAREALKETLSDHMSSWSPAHPPGATSAPRPDDVGSPDESDDIFLRAPRPLPRQRSRSNQPSVTPGIDTTRDSTPEQDNFLQDHRNTSQSPTRSIRSDTPATQDGYLDQASSPVPSHSTAQDIDLSTTTSTTHYKPQLILRGHKRAIAAVKFSPDGKWIASCSADATARIWSASTGRPIHVLTGHLAGISCLAWSPDSLTLATGSDDKSIRLWNVITGQPHATPLLGHHNYVYALAFSPAGNMLVSGSYDEAVFLWDVRTARVMRSLPAHSDPVGGVDFVRDGTLLVSCSSDGLIRVWDTASGQCLRTFFHEDTPPVVSVRFSPNGKYIATWMLDNSVRMWNYIEGRCVKTYQGHINGKYSLQGAFGTYHGEEAMIMSGSEDGSIVLWDINTKKVLQRLQGHEGAVMGVDVHPEERLIASCGMDMTIRIWKDKNDLTYLNGVNGTKGDP